MALNFADIANKKVEDIEKPPLPPVGTYRWSITKLPEITTSQDERWDILTIPVRAVEALDNVDIDSWKGAVTNITMAVRFIFNKEDEVEFEKTEYRMRQFFEKHVGCAESDATVMQMINSAVNGQFLGDVAWRQDKRNPEDFQADIARTAPIA